MFTTTRFLALQSCLLTGLLVCAPLFADEPQEPSTKQLLTAEFDLGQILTAQASLASNPLGIEVAPAEKALCAQLNIEGGLVITNVPDASEGSKAGLRAHDVILNINSQRSEPVRDIKNFNAFLAANSGKGIEIGLLRAGKMQLVAVTIPLSQYLTVPFKVETSHQVAGDHYRIGVALSEADDTLRAQLQLPAGEGLVVTEVIAASPAEKTGIKQHDVLVELNGKRLKTVEEVTQQIQDIQSRAVGVQLIRNGKPETVEVLPEKIAALATTAQAYVLLESIDQVWHPLPVRTTLKELSGTMMVLPQPATTWTASVLQAGEVAKTHQAQIAALKQQLAEMQKLLGALEASLTSAESKPSGPASEEKK